MRSAFAIVLFASLLGTSAGEQARVLGRDLNNRNVTSLGDSSNRAVVLFFVATDCPISNRTFPEMKRLREAFTAQGVRFWYVYTDPGKTRDDVAAHQLSFDRDGTAIRDFNAVLAQRADATVTPEVAVLLPRSGPDLHAPDWTPVYLGRIDDRYVTLGLERPQITEHFAERILREVLDHKPIEKPTGTPVGCGIVRSARGVAR